MKNKGFTLIELLAVIIILGVIMLIAIPSVTRQISDSRKNAYVDTARQIVKGAIPMVNGGELDMYDTNTTYYIPASCVPTENNFSSPFGDFKDAYVIVGYTGEGYVYYWASVDEAKQGIEMKEYNKLAKNDVKPNMEDVDTTLGIGSRTDIRILDKDECQTFELSESSNLSNVIIYPEGKNKDTVVLGDIVKIDTESFYVVKHNGNDLVLFANYNLKVGKNYRANPSPADFLFEYSPADDGYGLQSPTVKAWIESEVNAYGIVQFTEESYWNNKIGTTYPGNLCPSISNVNCATIFDSNSNLYVYIREYETKLHNMGVPVKEVRLLDNEELNLFITNGYIDRIKNTCFWLGTASTNQSANCFNTVGTLGPMGSVGGFCGVRPVIVI